MNSVYVPIWYLDRTGNNNEVISKWRVQERAMKELA